MNKNIGVGLVAVLIIATIGGYMFPKALPPFGAQSQSVTDGSCYNLEGVVKCPVRSTLTQATTTVCALKSPSATSTLVYGNMTMVNAATGTAYIMGFVKSTNVGTTSGAASGLGTQSLATTSIAANALGTLNAFASSTIQALDMRQLETDRTFNPNTYLVGYLQGGGGTFSSTGRCQAEFVVN